MFYACNSYLHQAWTNANDKMTVKDYIFFTKHYAYTEKYSNINCAECWSQQKGAGSQLWDAGSVNWGSGSQIRGAGSVIRRDPPQFNLWADVKHTSQMTFDLACHIYVECNTFINKITFDYSRWFSKTSEHKLLTTGGVPAMKPVATAIRAPQDGRCKITVSFDGRMFCVPKCRQ